MQTDKSVDNDTKIRIMKLKPAEGVLCFLDKIFDYLDFEDLEKWVFWWKLFWYTVTLDRILEKYEEDLWSSIKTVDKIDEDLVENMSLDNQETR